MQAGQGPGLTSRIPTLQLRLWKRGQEDPTHSGQGMHGNSSKTLFPLSIRLRLNGLTNDSSCTQSFSFLLAPPALPVTASFCNCYTVLFAWGTVGSHLRSVRSLELTSLNNGVQCRISRGCPRLYKMKEDCMVDNSQHIECHVSRV